MPVSKKQKSAKCGLIAKKWGPCFWLHMHMVAAGFPVKYAQRRRGAYRRYFKDIAKVLPCQKCREHYSEILNSYILDGTYDQKFRNRYTLQRFIFDVHNGVNRRLKKPVAHKSIIAKYSIDAIEKEYRAKC